MLHTVMNVSPPLAPRAKGKFPKPYNNQESRMDEKGQPQRMDLFHDWERPKDKQQLYEYPIKALDQPAPFQSNFDFSKKPAGLLKVHYKPALTDKAGIEARWEKPPNDPGANRFVTTDNGQIIGAMYHPQGNPRGLERAKVSPLNAEGRKERARVDDRVTGLKGGRKSLEGNFEQCAGFNQICECHTKEVLVCVVCNFQVIL
ncbi:hypothetical protein QBC41DRAFT_325795 [Cercophora samala]|uniref:Uncharacterized protein n=1 Tax=Cercophora samala TaxID=330535 RepID=A0AA39Z8V8_9PEZI|nr:hypothetical protein QBC41DRAFT_325795 [Cercophora samala]